jgi:hypothetical protein
MIETRSTFRFFLLERSQMQGETVMLSLSL